MREAGRAVAIAVALIVAIAAMADAPRFRNSQYPIVIGAGKGYFEHVWMNVTTDRETGATIYILTRRRLLSEIDLLKASPDVTGVEILGMAAVPKSASIPGPHPTPTPEPTPTPCPELEPLPADECAPSYAARLDVSTRRVGGLLEATFTPHWSPPPPIGVFSDHAIPVNLANVISGQPVTFAYPLPDRCPQLGFGFLSLWRDDGTRCDVAAQFEIPAR